MLQMNCVFRQSKYFSHLEPCVLKLISKSNPSNGLITRTCSSTHVLYQKVKLKTSNTPVPPPPTSDPNDNKKNTKTYAFVAGAVLAAGVSYLSWRYVMSTDDLKSTEKSKEKSVIRFPSDPKDIPKKVKYLLIGGGTASFSAFRAIKSADPTAKVLVVTNELYYPYMRPPLSKEMWFQNDKELLKKLNFKQWNGTERSLMFEPEDFYIESDLLENEPKGGIAAIRGWTVTKLNPEKKTAVLQDGTEIAYDKCLLATGIHPKNLPVFEEAVNVKDKVTLFRSVDDFKKLHKAISDGAKSVLIVGGSFLGSELACALAKNNTAGLRVTQVFPEKGNLAKILPAYLSSWTTEKIRAHGVEVIPRVEVTAASPSSSGKQVVVTLSNGSKTTADHIIVAVGSESNTDLAESAGLEVDAELGGFVVNSEMSARTDLYAAGDCSCFYDPHLGRRRVEHHDHAVTSGRLAGENMAGAHKAYSHQSMYWSDLGADIGFEAVGITDSSLPTVAIYAKPEENDPQEGKEENAKEAAAPEPSISVSLPKSGEDYSKGVIFYLKNDLIVGIVLWNVFNKVTLARQVLKERKKFDDLNEVAKLFDIHSDL